jgi:hypothetical protein
MAGTIHLPMLILLHIINLILLQMDFKETETLRS